MGLQSLPVAFGVETAKWITVGTIDVTQFSVAAYLAFGLHEPVYAAVLTALILPQARHLNPLQPAVRCMPDAAKRGFRRLNVPATASLGWQARSAVAPSEVWEASRSPLCVRFGGATLCSACRCIGQPPAAVQSLMPPQPSCNTCDRGCSLGMRAGVCAGQVLHPGPH